MPVPALGAGGGRMAWWSAEGPGRGAPGRRVLPALPRAEGAGRQPRPAEGPWGWL